MDNDEDYIDLFKKRFEFYKKKNDEEFKFAFDIDFKTMMLDLNVEPKPENYLSTDAMQFMKQIMDKCGPFDLSTSSGFHKMKRRVQLFTHPDKNRPESIYHGEFVKYFEAHKQWEERGTLISVRETEDRARKTTSMPTITNENTPPSINQRDLDGRGALLQHQRDLDGRGALLQHQQISASFINPTPHIVDIMEDICVDGPKELPVENVDPTVFIQFVSKSPQLSQPDTCTLSKKRPSYEITTLDKFPKKPKHEDMEVVDDDINQTKIDCQVKSNPKRKRKENPQWKQFIKKLFEYCLEKNTMEIKCITDVYSKSLFEIVPKNVIDKNKAIRTCQQQFKNNILDPKKTNQFYLKGYGIIEQVLTKKGKNNKISYRIIEMHLVKK
jgi:hypothetical protein